MIEYGALGSDGAGLVALRHVLRQPVAVDVGDDPVHVQEAVVGPVGDHAADLGVEAIDDRRRIRQRPPHREVQRPDEQRRAIRTAGASSPPPRDAS